jgi:phage terminase large subunit GpA-like protein
MPESAVTLTLAWRHAVEVLLPPRNLVDRTDNLSPARLGGRGPIRLWPSQRGIADALADPNIERLTLVKPVRVGFTSLLIGVLAHHVVNDPCPVLCVLPVESDSRDFIASDLEPIFNASPSLRGVLGEPGRTESGRNTILHRMFEGKSLKVVAAKAPRNLRRHTARILSVDEADACEVSADVSPIARAERRTLSFANRKIIVSSTSLSADTSHTVLAEGWRDASDDVDDASLAARAGSLRLGNLKEGGCARETCIAPTTA